MKKFFLILIFASSCGPSDYCPWYPNNAELYIEYNAILYNNWGPTCGSAIVKSTDYGAYAITAAHCIHYGLDYSLQPNNNELYSAILIAYNYENYDLAVLFAHDFPKQKAAPILRHEPEVGSFVWTVGYGAGVPDALSFGIVSKVGTEDHSNRITNMFDITSWYGNSGGGIYDCNGNLVGIVSQFGPQFSDHGPETGWMYVNTVQGIREITKEFF